MTDKEKIEIQINKISGLTEKVRFCPEFKVWQKDTNRILSWIFWVDSIETKDFNSIKYSLWIYVSWMSERDYSKPYLEWLQEASLLLKSIVSDFEESADQI
jgi:hypothetical protein